MLSLPHYIVVFFFVIVSAFGTIAHAYEVTLVWDPNVEPDLAGYILYVNDDDTSSSYYQLDAVSLVEIDPDNPMYTATELRENIQYCFALTAYDTDGYESGFSDEVGVINEQDDTVNLPPDSRNTVVSLTQGESSGSGGGWFISVSGDK